MLDKFNREINYLRVSITDRLQFALQLLPAKRRDFFAGHDDICVYEE